MVTRLITGYDVRNALVNGAAGLVTRDETGQLFSVMGFSVRDGRIVEVDVLADPERLANVDVTMLDRIGG